MALRKKFIDVEVPLLNETMQILGSQESLKGKTIKLDLTRILKGKALDVIFQIFPDQKPITAYPKRMTLMVAYIRRMIHPRSSYVEDSFEIQCKDVKATIKPFLITRKRVSRAIRNSLRKTCKELIVEYVKGRNYIELCEDILNKDLQKVILPKLKKVYPLSFCEVRDIFTREIMKANIEKKKVGDIAEKSTEVKKETKEEKIETVEAEKEAVQEIVQEIKEESKESAKEIKEDIQEKK